MQTWRGANLEGANLQRTKLKGAILVGASLEGCNFDATDLTGASLIDATLACQEEQAEEINDALIYFCGTDAKNAPSTKATQSPTQNAPQKFSHLRFADEEAETLWPAGIPKSIQGIQGISKEDLPPHWHDLEI